MSKITGIKFSYYGKGSTEDCFVSGFFEIYSNQEGYITIWHAPDGPDWNFSFMIDSFYLGGTSNNTGEVSLALTEFPSFINENSIITGSCEVNGYDINGNYINETFAVNPIATEFIIDNSCNLFVKINDTWAQANQIYIKHEDAWKQV